MQKNQENPGTQVNPELPLAEEQKTQAAQQEKAQKTKPAEKKQKKYTPEKGFENMVTVLVSRGDRFDPKTGKEVNPPVRVNYSYAEWQLVKRHHANLGIEFVEILYNPFEKEA